MRVLLVPDTFRWVLGTIARETKSSAQGLDFSFFTELALVYGVTPVEELQRASRSADVVHWLDTRGYRLYGKYVDKPQVVSFHHTLTPDGYRACEGADHVVVGSRSWEEYLLSHGIPRDRLTRTGYGVDLAVFRPYEEARRRLRDRLQLKPDDFAVGFFAKRSSDDMGRKGFDLLGAAMETLRETVPSCVLVVSGGGWSQDLERLRRGGVRCVDLSYQIGGQRQMARAYSALDLYLVSSRVEGGPVTILEALACGCPVASTSVGIAPDVINNGVNGLLFADFDPTGWAAAISELAGDSALLPAMRVAARLTAERFPWSRAVHGMEGIYRAVCAEVVDGSGDDGWAQASGYARAAHNDSVAWLRLLAGHGDRTAWTRCALQSLARWPSSRLLWREVHRVGGRWLRGRLTTLTKA